jgi:hypothetical protein
MVTTAHVFHDRAPTLTPLLHIAQIVSIRIRCNSPDIVLMGIEQPSWSSIESEILLLGALRLVIELVDEVGAPSDWVHID